MQFYFQVEILKELEQTAPQYESLQSHCTISHTTPNPSSEDKKLCCRRATILTYNDRTVTHLHIKWGVAVGPTVVGAGTQHLPPSRIHAPVTNLR